MNKIWIRGSAYLIGSLSVLVAVLLVHPAALHAQGYVPDYVPTAIAEMPASGLEMDSEKPADVPGVTDVPGAEQPSASGSPGSSMFTFGTHPEDILTQMFCAFIRHAHMAYNAMNIEQRANYMCDCEKMGDSIYGLCSVMTGGVKPQKCGYMRQIWNGECVSHGDYLADFVAACNKGTLVLWHGFDGQEN